MDHSWLLLSNPCHDSRNKHPTATDFMIDQHRRRVSLFSTAHVMDPLPLSLYYVGGSFVIERGTRRQIPEYIP
jgi:hypothetical protein